MTISSHKWHHTLVSRGPGIKCPKINKFWYPGKTTIGGTCKHCGEYINVALLRTEARDPAWLMMYEKESRKLGLIK